MEKFDYKSELSHFESIYKKDPNLLDKMVKDAEIIDEYFKGKNISKYIMRSFSLENKLSIEDRISYIKGLIYAELCIYTYYKSNINNDNIIKFLQHKNNYIKLATSDSKENDKETKMIKKAMKIWFHIDSITPRADYFYKYIISDEDIDEIKKIL